MMHKILSNPFPWLMVVLSAGASIVYFCQGDLRRGFYWLFATGITVAVTL